MTEAEWLECLRQMKLNEAFIRAWEPEPPNPNAIRCVQSRHRTLAHLRACQETWLAACVAFDQKKSPHLKSLHPWRSFEQRGYERLPWEDHFNKYMADRSRWTRLLASTDRLRSGKLNDKPFSIESLTHRLVYHEHQHLFMPR